MISLEGIDAIDELSERTTCVATVSHEELLGQFQEGRVEQLVSFIRSKSDSVDMTSLLDGGASLSIEEANQELEAGWIDMVTCGRHILANPDFVTRARMGQEWMSMTNEMREGLL